MWSSKGTYTPGTWPIKGTEIKNHSQRQGCEYATDNCDNYEPTCPRTTHTHTPTCWLSLNTGLFTSSKAAAPQSSCYQLYDLQHGRSLSDHRADIRPPFYLIAFDKRTETLQTRQHAEGRKSFTLLSWWYVQELWRTSFPHNSHWTKAQKNWLKSIKKLCLIIAAFIVWIKRLQKNMLTCELLTK